MNASQPIDDDEAREHALQRLEILDAFAVALDRRGELIEITASSADAEQARSRLRESFGFTEVQAIAALDLQVRRFAERQRQQIIDERDDIRARYGIT